MPRFLLLLLVIFMGSYGAAFGQVYHKVQGTNIWAVPPKDYETSHTFTGFTNEETGGSILVISLPYREAAKTYNEFQKAKTFITTMKNQGFDISGYKEDTTRDGIHFRVYSGTQKSDGILYYRWVSMFSVDQAAYVIAIQSPDKNEFNEADIIKIYQQLRFMGERDIPEAIAALPFSFTPEKPFIIDTILMGNTVQLSVPNNENSPHIMISMDAGYALSPDDAANAQKLYLASIVEGFKVKPDAQSQTVEFAGNNGLLLEGTAETSLGNTDFLLYTSVDKNGRIFYLHATGKPEELEKYKTQIKEIVKSVKPRPIAIDKNQ